MRHLFIARHGKYGGDDRISPYGVQEMKELGKAIKQISDGNSIYLLSSTAPRAMDSSRVLADELGLNSEFETMDYLWTGDNPGTKYYCYSDKSRNNLYQIVEERREKANSLIILAHFEIGKDFPSYFLQKEFNHMINLWEINKGEAVHFDLLEKSHQILP